MISPHYVRENGAGNEVFRHKKNPFSTINTPNGFADQDPEREILSRRESTVVRAFVPLPHMRTVRKLTSQNVGVFEKMVSFLT